MPHEVHDWHDTVRTMRQAGESIAAIEKAVGRSKTQVGRILRRFRDSGVVFPPMEGAKMGCKPGKSSGKGLDNIVMEMVTYTSPTGCITTVYSQDLADAIAVLEGMGM